MGIVENSSCIRSKNAMPLWTGEKNNCFVRRKRKIQKLPKADMLEFILQELKNRRFIQETLIL